jgi:hypothetical protein
MSIDKQRIAAVAKLEELGFTFSLVALLFFGLLVVLAMGGACAERWGLDGVHRAISRLSARWGFPL